jgi:REP element-mobilizing transposase RayT
MAKRTRQLVLALPEQCGWGGRRAGAGRKPADVRRDPHRKRPPLAARFPCLVTLKVRGDVPSLRRVRFVRELEQSLRALCERAEFRVVHYSIQGNHVHAVVEATSTAGLSRGMKALGARIARAANRVFGRRGPVLSERFHLRILRTPREVRNAIAYVLLNARRHAAKLREFLRRPARVDPASSGRWFQGWHEAVPRAADAACVASPGTWLLAVGWRRHGLVRVDEVPGGAGDRAPARRPTGT